jgi:hypothetical protein
MLNKAYLENTLANFAYITTNNTANGITINNLTKLKASVLELGAVPRRASFVSRKIV